MPSTDDSKILPPMMNDRARPRANRTMLGVLIALLAIAVLFALFRFAFGDDDPASGAQASALPTPVTIPATPTPVGGIGLSTTDEANATPTTAPVATATPVPEGFEACATAAAPSTTGTYIVDTNTTPLNQRSEPAVSAPQAGTFDPGQTGLSFTGDCVVNIADGYTWWKIFNGTEDVWIASSFVTAN